MDEGGASRPVITNPIVPALEVLRPACIEARSDDVDSYVEDILKLIDNPGQYRILCEASPDLAKPFYDRQQGMTAVLQKVVNPNQ